MDRLNSPKTLFIAVTVDGLLFPQRKALGFDPRESTPGFKRHVTILNSETRSFKRVAIVMDRVLGLKVSANTIERICLDVGGELADAEQEQWQSVLKGEVSVPQLAIVEFDGGRIRTGKQGCGSGVHLANKGWNETKNAIFVSAASETFPSDPQPEPPACFLDSHHVAKLTETAKTREKQGSNDEQPEEHDNNQADVNEGTLRTTRRFWISFTR